MLAAQITVPLVALGFIAWPFIGRRQDASADAALEQVEQIRREANIALYREQQELLEEQYASGEIEQQEYQQRLNDLGQLLIDNTQTVSGAASANSSRGLWLLPILALGLFVSVWVSYRHYGAELDLEITAKLDSLEGRNGAEMEQLEGLIKERLKRNPESAYFWNLLAQRALGRAEFATAAEYFGSSLEWATEDGWLHAQHAQALFFAAQRQFTDAVNLALDRAYGLAPNDQTVLGLKGVQAFEMAEYATAISYWQRAQAGLDSSGPGWQALQSGIERSRQLAQQEDPSVDLSADSATVSIELALTLDAGLELFPGQRIFVAIVEAGGRPMPIAARVFSAQALPPLITITASDQLTPARSLSDVDELMISVRLSATGSATPSEGDKVVRSQPFTLVDGTAQLSLKLVP
ncbi:MAG: c-type cytochrome biogenesis protein CcmI [Porticoccaceae bacterium]